jgi:hypothetical protein
LIPLIHRVDRLRELRARGLVDTARIYPNPVIAMNESLTAATSDFYIALQARGRLKILDILKRDLFFLPCVR